MKKTSLVDTDFDRFFYLDDGTNIQTILGTEKNLLFANFLVGWHTIRRVYLCKTRQHRCKASCHIVLILFDLCHPYTSATCDENQKTVPMRDAFAPFYNGRNAHLT